LEHNLALLRALPRLAALGSPVLVGVSRKSFIGRILGRATEERVAGGLGLAALAVSMGARIIRTHDVAPTRDAIRMVSAVLRESAGAGAGAEAGAGTEAGNGAETGAGTGRGAGS
jgi:dihydropteroate synthase